MVLVEEWIEKAESDFEGAQVLNRRRKQPLPELVCYHCQQSVEKYLKAFLVSKGAQPPRTHDLVQLLDLCSTSDSSLSGCQPLVEFVDPYGVEVRYPGVSATVDEANDVMKATRHLRGVFRRALKL